MPVCVFMDSPCAEEERSGKNACDKGSTPALLVRIVRVAHKNLGGKQPAAADTQKTGK